MKDSEEKIKDLEFIKNFSNIKVSKICEELKISRGNLYTARTSKENIKKVRNEIEKRYNNLYK